MHRWRTLIIGKNGTLKSTLLRCIAIGLCDPQEANTLVGEPIGQFITEGYDSATITIDLHDDDSIGKRITAVTEIVAKGEKEIVVFDNKKEMSYANRLFVCAYGAGRSTESPDRFRAYRIVDSVYSLFEYEQGMIDTELTLRRLRDFLGTNTYKTTMKGIKKALGLTERDKIELPRGGGILVSGPTIGKKIPLSGWADGYRLSFKWIMDLYAWAMKANQITSSGGISGIILIDEVEQHIHPSMQTNILKKISHLFPKAQIFATTHSPLVALGSKPEELVVLKRKRKYVQSEETIPDFTSYSAEDMLIDERLFNTSAYSPSTNEMLSQYYQLAAISKNRRTSKQTTKLKSLAIKLRSQNLLELRRSTLADELKLFREKYDL